MHRERANRVGRSVAKALPPAAWLALAAVLFSASLARAATVSNTAQLDYVDPIGGPATQFSNTVSLQTAPGPSPGTVTLFRYAPSAGSAQPTRADGAQC